MEPQNIYTLSNYCAVRTKHKTTPYEITAKAYCCWADDSDSQFFGFVVKLSCFCFWNSFSDDGDRANLLRKNKTFLIPMIYISDKDILQIFESNMYKLSVTLV